MRQVSIQNIKQVKIIILKYLCFTKLLEKNGVFIVGCEVRVFEFWSMLVRARLRQPVLM